MNIKLLFYDKRRLIFILAIVALIIAIPLTIFIAQKRQEMRQRASGEEARVFFAEDTSGTPVEQVSLGQDQTKRLYVYLDMSTASTPIPINGYDVKISLANLSSLLENITVEEGTDSSKFNNLIFSNYDASNSEAHFSKVSTDTTNDNITGKLQIGIISFLVKPSAANGTSGSLGVTSAIITSSNQSTRGLTIQVPVELNYTIGTPTNTPTPTATADSQNLLPNPNFSNNASGWELGLPADSYSYITNGALVTRSSSDANQRNVAAFKQYFFELPNAAYKLKATVTNNQLPDNTYPSEICITTPTPTGNGGNFCLKFTETGTKTKELVFIKKYDGKPTVMLLMGKNVSEATFEDIGIYSTFLKSDLTVNGATINNDRSYTAVKNTALTFTIDASTDSRSSLSHGWLEVIKTDKTPAPCGGSVGGGYRDGGPWCRLKEAAISGTSGNYSGTWTPDKAGEYYITSSLFNTGSVQACTSAPWCDFGEGSCLSGTGSSCSSCSSIWTQESCGKEGYIKLTITEPPALPAPKNTSAACTSNGLASTISWDAVNGASFYMVRMDNRGSYSPGWVDKGDIVVSVPSSFCTNGRCSYKTGTLIGGEDTATCLKDGANCSNDEFIRDSTNIFSSPYNFSIQPVGAGETYPYAGKKSEGNFSCSSNNLSHFSCTIRPDPNADLKKLTKSSALAFTAFSSNPQVKGLEIWYDASATNPSPHNPNHEWQNIASCGSSQVGNCTGSLDFSKIPYPTNGKISIECNAFTTDAKTLGKDKACSGNQGLEEANGNWMYCGSRSNVALNFTSSATSNGAKLSFNLAFLGIGVSIPPVHQTVNLTACLYKPNVDPTDDYSCAKASKKIDSTVSYNQDSKKFVNDSFDLGEIESGNYWVFVKANKYLRKRVPVEISINSAQQQVSIPELTLIAGDINNDNVINIADYSAYLDCYDSKANSASCVFKENADLNDDGKTDIYTNNTDWRILFTAFQNQKGD